MTTRLSPPEPPKSRAARSESVQEPDGTPAYAYEAVFCIFLSALAYLGRGQQGWDYPRILYLLLLLLAFNLAGSLALRRWAGHRALSAAVILANCAVITAILDCSGGRGSLLWVLYLLPVFTASMFLSGREVAWVAAGATAFNAAFCASTGAAWDASCSLDLGLRSGIMTLAAVLTWRTAERERRARDQVRLQRGELTALLVDVEAGRVQDASSKALAELGLLTASVLHDLKTPLTVILGFADVGMQGGDPALARRDFERIKQAGLLCKGIVERFTAVAPGRRLALAPCDLREILSATHAMCAAVFDRRRLSLRCNLPEEPVPIKAEFQQLQRVFLNLFSNAAQALPSGGTLEVSLRAAATPPRAEVVFEDDGPGLSEPALAGLFKPFSTTKAGQGGTGLGLYICRQIVLSHGGSLRAENRAGGGARFTVSVPLRVSENALKPEFSAP